MLVKGKEFYQSDSVNNFPLKSNANLVIEFSFEIKNIEAESDAKTRDFLGSGVSLLSLVQNLM